MSRLLEIGEPIEIREMTEDDLDEILEIERRTFPSPWSRGLFEKELRTSFARSYVARERGSRTAVGYLCFWVVGPETHVLNLAVHPEFRGRKIASQLLAFGLEVSRKQGANLVTLEVRRSNYPAISLYRSFRFQPRGIRRRYYTDSGEDAIVMGLDLESPQIPSKE